MFKVKVHYDKKHVIELNIGCQPQDVEGLRKHAEMIFATLQRDGRGFPYDRYPDARSMMVGDIIEWVGLDYCARLDPFDWNFFERKDLDILLSMPDNPTLN